MSRALTSPFSSDRPNGRIFEISRESSLLLNSPSLSTRGLAVTNQKTIRSRMSILEMGNKGMFVYKLQSPNATILLAQGFQNTNLLDRDFGASVSMFWLRNLRPKRNFST